MRIPLQRHEKRLVEEAVRLAVRTPLPLTARSLTPAEVAIRDRRYRPVLFIVALVLLLVLAAVAMDPDTRYILPVLVLISLLYVALWPIAQARMKRRQAYRDPQILVEVKNSGLTIKAFGDAFDLSYADADFDFIFFRYQGLPYFQGIALQTPFGQLRIEDDWFKPGTTAAAAIVKLCGDAGLYREQGRQPRVR